jgi:hypothetical protein
VTRRPVRDLPASVRQRLLNLAHQRGEEFQHLLSRYARERLLYRLACSPHHDRFVLKGALLFSIWADEPHRPTRDLDLLGRGEHSIPGMVTIFQQICSAPVEADGIEFLADSVRGGQIRQDQECAGLRIELTARLSGAVIPVRVDVGFDDTVTPAPLAVEFPTLLEFPAPRVLAYTREAVVAEKFHAMVTLGIGNSRMKDFFDIWALARAFSFQGADLVRALRATFTRRDTSLPTEAPLALTDAFCEDASKKAQWNAFLRRSRLDTGETLAEVAAVLRELLMPPVLAGVRDEPFAMRWPPSGPWQPDGDA